jgi:hypothetical protein
MDAQESLKMTRETTKQGRTVLIFALTTIVFLPLSFMTSFFTLDISQFRTNAEGKLDLGYVSYIVCKYFDILFLRKPAAYCQLTYSPRFQPHIGRPHLDRV